MTSFSRKYVIRLLCGSRVYKKLRGRAPTYSKEARDHFVKIWFALGKMCSRYLHSIIEKAIADYQEARPNVYFSPEVVRELLQMSPSTMARILRPHQFQMSSANKRSENKATIVAGIPAAPETLYEKKGAFILQVDTVALRGAICAKVSFESYTSQKLRRCGVCVHLFRIVVQKQHAWL